VNKNYAPFICCGELIFYIIADKHNNFAINVFKEEKL